MTSAGASAARERLDARCRRAEEEYPRLAAPDGTVAVPIGDLRLLLNASAGEAGTATDSEAGVAEGEHATAAGGDAQEQPLEPKD